MVQAVNVGSQSVPSDSIFFTMPPLEAPVAKVQAKPVLSFNGNGGGAAHANGNGSRTKARV
jgi:hypothetical protein